MADTPPSARKTIKVQTQGHILALWEWGVDTNVPEAAQPYCKDACGHRPQVAVQYKSLVHSPHPCKCNDHKQKKNPPCWASLVHSAATCVFKPNEYLSTQFMVEIIASIITKN